MNKSLLLLTICLLFGCAAAAQLPDVNIHAAAAQWRYNRLKDEQGNFYPQYVARAINSADHQRAISRSNGLGLQWQELGPTNVGGYMTCLLIDKRDTTNNTLYAGSFNGGIWKSTDGAETWQPLSGWNQWMAISCIEQAPAPDYSIYIGTGDGVVQPQGSSYSTGNYGNGIYKLDINDQQVLLTPNVFSGNLYDPGTNVWSSVNAIAVDKAEPVKIIAATQQGLYWTTNAGANWTKVLLGSLANYGNEPVMDVKWSNNGQNIFAAFGYAASTNAILYSNDGGNTWKVESTATNSGFPTGSNGRTSLAFAPSNSNIMYAQMATINFCEKGVYKSSDAGATWVKAVDTGGIFSIGNGCQGWYDNTLAVSPADTDKAYLGGVNFFTLSRTYGITAASVGSFNESNPYYITPDIKSITIADNNPDLMYVCSDGGVFKSTDALSGFPTPAYAVKNKGLGITLNYGIGAGINGDVIGGAQNGTFYINPWAANPKDGQPLLSSVGDVNAVSQIDTDAWFGGGYYARLLRSTDHCSSFTEFFDLKVDPMGEGGATVCGGGSVFSDAQFITPFYLGETKNAANGIKKVSFIAAHNYSSGTAIAVTSSTVNYPFNFTLTQNLNAGDTLLIDDPIRSRLFMSTNCGVYVTTDPLSKTDIPEWFKLYGNLSGSAQSFVTTPDGDNLFIGTDNGNVYHFSNLNAHADTVMYPTGVTVGLLYPNSNDVAVTGVATGRRIEGIDVDPNNNNHVVAVVAGFSTSESQPHVYESFDGGVTWAPDTTGLPNMPVYTVWIHDTHTIIIGTEFGVWSWDGSSWHEENGNFYRMPVYRMIERPLYQDGCDVLYIGSHGRGMWRSTTLTPQGCNSGIPTAINNITLNEIGTMNIYPNPVNNEFKVSLTSSTATNVTMNISDVTGRLLTSRGIKALPGQNVFEMDGSSLANGVYVLTALMNSNKGVSKLFAVIR